MPFKVPPGTKTITEMAPTKSNDRILPITEEALPYFLRQFDLIARQKALTEAGGGVYYDNKLFIAKPDGSPQRRDRMSANFGQLIRHLEMPHIRFHDLRHTAATNMHQLRISCRPRLLIINRQERDASEHHFIYQQQCVKHTLVFCSSLRV